MFDARKMIIDPLFQLNLMLWQTMPGMPGSRHLLNEAGYKVHSISPQLGIPLDVQEKMNTTDIEYQKSVSPDLIVRSSDKFSMIEMKKDSFGKDSSTSRQANSLLLLNNGVLLESIGYPKKMDIGTFLSYLTVEKRTDLQRKTMRELENALSEKGMETVENSVIGIDCDEDNNIYLCIDSESRNGLALKEDGKIRILESDAETDPTPLYLIPHDPNSDHDGKRSVYTEKVFKERVHSLIISAIGLARSDRETEIKVDVILDKLTLGMFKLWGDRGSTRTLRKRVNGYLNDISLKTEKRIFKKDGKWVFKIKSFEERDELISVLKRISLEIRDFEIPSLYEFK